MKNYYFICALTVVNGSIIAFTKLPFWRENAGVLLIWMGLTLAYFVWKQDKLVRDLEEFRSHLSGKSLK